MYFDDMAAIWDDSPQRQQRALAAATEILSQLEDTQGKHALEFGSGTGLLGLNLRKNFASITLLDESQGMTEKAREKILEHDVSNLRAQCLTLTDSSQLDRSYDVIFSQMAFHHVMDYLTVFRIFHQNLNPSGKFFIIDLMQEDGSFHGPGFDGHKGFDPDKLAAELTHTGFRNVRWKNFYTLKRNMGGRTREYPLFILSGEK